MHTNEPREIQGIEQGYDPRDVEPKSLLRVVIYFFMFTNVFFGGGAIWWYYIGRVTNISKFDPRKPAFDGPKIQGNMTAKTDIMAVRQHERMMMTTYGTNADGKQRIPIDRALDLISTRGLPAVTSPEPAKSPGTTIRQNAVGVTPGSPGEAGLAGAATTGGAPSDATPVPATK